MNEHRHLASGEDAARGTPARHLLPRERHGGMRSCSHPSRRSPHQRRSSGSPPNMTSNTRPEANHRPSRHLGGELAELPLSAWESVRSGLLCELTCSLGYPRVTVRGPSLPVNGTLLARQASPDPAIGRIGNELADAMDPTALAALGAMVRIGSGWTSVVNRSFLDGPHGAELQPELQSQIHRHGQVGQDRWLLVVGWADVRDLQAVVRWIGCSYQDARLLRGQSCRINRFVPVRQLTS
jgi:hypothetical protein